MSADPRFLMPGEPQRFNANDINTILEHCSSNEASDITIQSNEPIFAEIQGHLYHVTKRKLTHQKSLPYSMPFMAQTARNY